MKPSVHNNSIVAGSAAAPPESAENLLRKFLTSADEQTADRLLEELLAELANSIVRPTLLRRLRFYQGGFNLASQETEDLCNEILLKLLKRFRALRAAADTETLYNVRGYCASIAFNSCYEYLRARFPSRTRLKNKLRYLLNCREDFAVWENEQNVLFCGFRSAQKTSRLIDEKKRAFFIDSSSFRQRLPQRLLTDETKLDELIREIFLELDAPVELDELVRFVGVLTGIEEPHSDFFAEAGETIPEHGGNRAPRAQTATSQSSFRLDELSEQARIEQRENMRRLWEEIKLLPVRQRSALLLNLKDQNGNAVVSFLTLTRAATLREIAAALEIEIEDFARIWQDLPLEDAQIAALLGATRQQVINLRKSARERLMRRFKGF